MKTIEVRAKSREAAIAQALQQLGVERYEIEVEIIDEGSAGFLGFGRRDVAIRVTADVPDDTPRSTGGREDRDRGENRGDRGDRGDRGRNRGRDRDRGPRSEQDARPAREERPPREERPAREERKPREEETRAEGGDASSEERGGRGRGRRGRGGRDRNRDDRGPRNGDARVEGEARAEGGRGDRSPREDRPARNDRPPREERAPRPRREDRPPRNAEPAVPVEFDRAAAEAQGHEASALLQTLIGLMGIEATISSEVLDEGAIRLSVSTEDSAILIGRKGQTLRSLQYIINRMVHEGEVETGQRLLVDIEGYIDRRKSKLEEMALRLADRAKETRRRVRMKPLTPQERRIIHLTLQDDPDIRTFSVGHSDVRSVVIAPKDELPDERGRNRDDEDEADENGEVRSDRGRGGRDRDRDRGRGGRGGFRGRNRAEESDSNGDAPRKRAEWSDDDDAIETPAPAAKREERAAAQSVQAELPYADDDDASDAGESANATAVATAPVREPVRSEPRPVVQAKPEPEAEPEEDDNPRTRREANRMRRKQGFRGRSQVLGADDQEK